MEELKACPFCGAAGWITLFGAGLVRIGCCDSDCFLHSGIQVVIGETLKGVAIWNRRVEEKP